MFMLVLVTCMTFDGVTHCDSFERAPQYESQEKCERSAALERGRYRDRIARRTWMQYRWRCLEATEVSAKPATRSRPSRRPSGQATD